eukprot:scaffold36300_cov52-Cyclotella_meneghiniana.AAC.1
MGKRSLYTLSLASIARQHTPPFPSSTCTAASLMRSISCTSSAISSSVTVAGKSTCGVSTSRAGLCVHITPGPDIFTGIDGWDRSGGSGIVSCLIS